MIKEKKNLSRAGFTLIELILYIAIVSIFITGAVLFTWDVVYGSVKSTTQQEVTAVGQLLSKRILYEVRNATAITSLSSSDLCLTSENATYNPTRIYQSGSEIRIAWGGGSSDCTSMTFDESLTSNQVEVVSLSFQDLSSGPNSAHVKFTTTLRYLNPSARSEWEFEKQFTGSAEVRNR